MDGPLTLAMLAVSAVLVSAASTAPAPPPRTVTQTAPAPPPRTVTQTAPTRTVTKTVTTPAQTVTTPPSRTATVTQTTVTSAKPTVTVATTGAGTDSDGSVPWWVWLLIALGVAGVAVGIVLARRRSPPDDQLPPA